MAEHFYFAWINEGEVFNPAVHNRNDEDVFSFEWEHSEGDFAGLKVQIKNPRIGLLNPGRPLWAFLAFNDGSQGSPIPVCFFKGRLIGIPSNVFDTLVTLDFIARPSNFSAQKVALANTMKVLPYYDPIFVKPDSWGDPDVVLEAYSRLWYIDPVTHLVSTSDILVPEDGTVEVQEEDHFYDDMQLTLNQTPLRAVTMTATIPWQQSGAGGVDITGKLLDHFVGRTYVTSYTFSGLLQDWPKPGSKFGSGWEVLNASLNDVTGTRPKAIIPDIFSWQGTVPDLPQGSVVFPIKVTGEFHSGEKAGFNFQYEIVAVQLGFGVPQLSVTYARDAPFAQVVTFTMLSAQQAIITLPGEDEAFAIALNANRVSDVTENNTIPIGDTRRRSYVHTSRGLQSLEYLLLVARAHLIARSRAVEITFKMGFKLGFHLRFLKKASLLHDHRLPGGEAIGKIVSVKMRLSGDDGAATVEVGIASCVGKGGSHVASAGTPTYVDVGYMDDTQEYENTVVLTDTADVAWTLPVFAAFDDGIDFMKGLNTGNAVILNEIVNPPQSQEVAIKAAGNAELTDQAAISEALKDIPTKFRIQMRPMEGGPFQGEVVLSISDLVIPKQIDLEAPSNA